MLPIGSLWMHVQGDAIEFNQRNDRPFFCEGHVIIVGCGDKGFIIYDMQRVRRDLWSERESKRERMREL